MWIEKYGENSCTDSRNETRFMIDNTSKRQILTLDDFSITKKHQKGYFISKKRNILITNKLLKGIKLLK